MTVANVPPAPASTAGVTPSTQPADVTDVSSAAFSTILVTALAGTQAVNPAQTMSAAQSSQPATDGSETTSAAAPEEELSIEIEQLPGDIAALLGAAPPPPPAPDEIDMTFSAEDIGADLELMSGKPGAARAPLPQAVEAAAIAEPLIEFSAPSTPESPQTLTHVQPTTATAVDAAAQSEAPAPREIRAPVGTPAWADEIGGELTLMTQQGRESASLKVTPEHLGPIEIRITLNDKDASVWFGAAHSDTRAALEQALPRLRELFESQGLALTDAGVFRDPPKQQSQSESLSASDRHPSDNDDSGSVTPVSGKTVGLLDTYV